jgi:hypothetical protein
MSKENIKLTPIQTEYKELTARRDTIFESAIQRMAQIDKEIQSLYNEQIQLEEMVNTIRDINSKSKNI